MELLVAVALLVLIILPLLDLGTQLRAGLQYERQLAVTVATSKLEELANDAYRSAQGTWPVESWPTPHPTQVGSYTFDLQWRIQPDPASDWVSQATVVVTCQNCRREMPPVRMTALLGKVPPCSGQTCIPIEP